MRRRTGLKHSGVHLCSWIFVVSLTVLIRLRSLTSRDFNPLDMMRPPSRRRVYSSFKARVISTPAPYSARRNTRPLHAKFPPTRAWFAGTAANYNTVILYYSVNAPACQVMPQQFPEDGPVRLAGRSALDQDREVAAHRPGRVEALLRDGSLPAQGVVNGDRHVTRLHDHYGVRLL